DTANRFFVTGHSLGGAVANIVAHRLAQNGVDRSAIYGYTYGTPWTANRSDADARADNNIFNFIGGSTMLSEAFDNFCWGSDETYSNMSGGSFDYTEFMRKCRYGTDKTFDNQDDAFKAAYRTLTGNEYDPDGTLAKHLVSTYLGYILADQSVSASVENGVRTVTINGGALPTEPDPEPEPMTAELVSSEGTDLEAKTNTLLQVNMQNADPADYTFKFIVYNTTTNQWYKLKDFGPETEYNWYTGPAGVKNLYVDIKDADGEVTRISLTGVNVTDNGVKVDTFSSSEGDVLPAKSYTTLTAAAKDGTAPYTYKFIVHNNDNDQWYRIRDFGDAPTCEWYTGPAGNKTLYVDVKDATGQVVRGPLDVTVQ
ncbi:MAG: hypothetical protein J5847_02135, partial [Clostridia bacterium]|nr:hypothetical protein [Clostridia bacterium]